MRNGRAAFTIEALDFIPLEKTPGDGAVATFLEGRPHVLVDGEAIVAPDMSYVPITMII